MRFGEERIFSGPSKAARTLCCILSLNWSDAKKNKKKNNYGRDELSQYPVMNESEQLSEVK